MELRELKEKIENHNGYNFLCIDIVCDDCIFFNNLNNSCEGMMKDYDWNKIKVLDLPDDTVVTKELLKNFKHKT